MKLDSKHYLLIIFILVLFSVRVGENRQYLLRALFTPASIPQHQEDHAKKTPYHGPQWSYAGATGSAHWGDLAKEFKTCKTGQQQSPIDLPALDTFTQVSSNQAQKIAFNYQPIALSLTNTGHTIKVDASGAGYIEVDGQHYDLLHYHFHAPSEHTVASQPYAMEVHLVHKNSRGELAVVAIFLKEGEENTFLKAFWNALPSHTGEVERYPDWKPNVTGLLPENHDFITFRGSLTTPPCSEGVLWLVMKTPVSISTEQVVLYNTRHPNSARPVQEINHRLITLHSQKGVFHPAGTKTAEKPTTVETKAITEDPAYAAGRQACITDPASCGLASANQNKTSLLAWSQQRIQLSQIDVPVRDPQTQKLTGEVIRCQGTMIYAPEFNVWRLVSLQPLSNPKANPHQNACWGAGVWMNQ
ncbi:carbonic anhydrase [Magnetococcales bacterium HHB-1]